MLSEDKKVSCDHNGHPTKEICRVNEFPTQIPTQFSTYPERKIFTFRWKHKGKPRIAKTILKDKKKYWISQYSWFQAVQERYNNYYKIIVLLTQKKIANQLNKIEDPDKFSHIGQLIFFIKMPKIHIE